MFDLLIVKLITMVIILVALWSADVIKGKFFLFKDIRKGLKYIGSFAAVILFILSIIT